MRLKPEKLKGYLKNWRRWAALPFVLLIALPLLPVYMLLEKMDWYHGTPRWMRCIFIWVDDNSDQ